MGLPPNVDVHTKALVGLGRIGWLSDCSMAGHIHGKKTLCSWVDQSELEVENGYGHCFHRFSWLPYVVLA